MRGPSVSRAPLHSVSPPSSRALQAAGYPPLPGGSKEASYFLKRRQWPEFVTVRRRGWAVARPRVRTQCSPWPCSSHWPVLNSHDLLASENEKKSADTNEDVKSESERLKGKREENGRLPSLFCLSEEVNSSSDFLSCLFVSRGANCRGFVIPPYIRRFPKALHDAMESGSANGTKVIRPESEERSQEMSISRMSTFFFFLLLLFGRRKGVRAGF